MKYISFRILSLNIIMIYALFGCINDDSGYQDKESGQEIIKETVRENIPDEDEVDFPSNQKLSKILIPRSVENSIWYSTANDQSKLPENIEIIPDVTGSNVQKKEVDFGSAYNNENFYTGAVIAEKKIFVIDAKGVVSAYNPLDISKKYWEHDLGKYSKDFSYDVGGMLYDSGFLFITSGGQKIFALNVNDGTLAWEKKIENIIRSAPASGEGKLYVMAVNDTVYAIDMFDSSIVWQHSKSADSVSVYGSASPVYKDHMVFVPYSSGKLYALRSFDGKEVWSKSFGKSLQNNEVYTFRDIKASPLIVNDVLLMLSLDGFFMAGSSKTGSYLWEHRISGYSTPWHAGDYVYFISKHDKLISVNVYNGTIAWIKDIKDYINIKEKKGKIFHKKKIFFSGPVLASDLLRVISSEGKMLSVSPIDGELRSVSDIISDVYLPPVIAFNHMYLVSNNSKLISLHTKDDFIK